MGILTSGPAPRRSLVSSIVASWSRLRIVLPPNPKYIWLVRLTRLLRKAARLTNAGDIINDIPTSPVATINGTDAVDFLTNFSKLYYFQDADSR